MIFETHAHYDDEAFEEDRDALLESLPANHITQVVNVGSSLESIRRAIALAQTYPHVWAAAGVHPSETEELDEESLSWVRSQLSQPKVVAVGEIGLDYHWPEPGPELQKKWFERQLWMAKEEAMPVIIHSRDAAEDTLDMMKSEAARGLTGVIHCFSYSPELAREYLKLGFYIGIGGVLTFKNARKLKEIAALAPLSRLLLETDCPYMAPVPHRGERNSSLYLPYVVQALAEIRGLPVEEIMRVTYENACRMYRVKG